jgi:hypothetical protein
VSAGAHSWAAPVGRCSQMLCGLQPRPCCMYPIACLLLCVLPLTCWTYSSGGTLRLVAASYRSKLSAARFMLSAVRRCTSASTCYHNRHQHAGLREGQAGCMPTDNAFLCLRG